LPPEPALPALPAAPASIIVPATVLSVPPVPACAVALLPADWLLVMVFDVPLSADDVPASIFETPPFMEVGEFAFVGEVPDEFAST
jgi:hypothetical protein